MYIIFKKYKTFSFNTKKVETDVNESKEKLFQ